METGVSGVNGVVGLIALLLVEDIPKRVQEKENVIIHGLQKMVEKIVRVILQNIGIRIV